MKRLIKIFFCLVVLFIQILVPGQLLIVEAASYDEIAFENELNAQNFPESYKSYLRNLKSIHPNWGFVAFHTNLDWNTVLDNQEVIGRSLVQNKAKSWLSTAVGAYDWTTDTYTPRDGTTWFQASRQTIAYFMDPRNFLNEKSVFMFESLAYQAGKHDLAGVNAIISGTFMSGESYSYPDGTGTMTRTYSASIIDAAIHSGVSPYHIASRIRQELGVNGSMAVSGTLGSHECGGVVYPGYQGYYNFYNIGASPGATCDPYGSVRNGLAYASTTNNDDPKLLLPWNNPYKAILGGAHYIGIKYVNAGQNTLYLQKFDVEPNYHGLYWHQYATNLEMPNSEAQRLYTAYNQYGMIDSNMTFVIPVYKNMTETASVKPIDAGSPNNWLKSISVTGHSLAPTFNINTNSTGPYDLIVDSNVSKITINAEKVSSTATLSGTGEKTLNVGNNQFIVKVTAENGEVRNYTINIVRQSQSDSDLKNNPYLNENDTVTGMEPGTTIAQLISKISSETPGASVTVKTSTGEAITSGNIKTGMVAHITYNAKPFQYTVVLYGDVTGDGNINVLDLLSTQKHILGVTIKNGVYKEAMNVNKNADVNVLDLLAIQRHILNISKITQ